MKILIVHNRYQQRGGEDSVVDIEYDLLKRSGVQVELCEVDNDEIQGLAAKLRSAATVVGSSWGRAWMAERIAGARPDIVHVHNAFPRLTPSIYGACRAAGVPVVQTLHNFRIMCAAGTFVRSGKACEKCLHGSPYQAVMHRCYRGSMLGSLALAHMIDHHRRAKTYAREVDVFIALTEFARGKFIEAGLPADRLVVKPNTAPDPGPIKEDQSRHGALFVGRLSEEKGLTHLLDAWRNIAYPLRIAGTGPLMERLRSAAPANVTFLGKLTLDEVGAEMARAAFLAVPSTGYEGFPMVVVEAYARGLPVLASRLGSVAEIVEQDVTGQLFEPGDAASLAAVVKHILTTPSQLARLGVGARATYDYKYSTSVVAKQLLSIYGDVLAGRTGRHDRTRAIPRPVSSGAP